MTEGDSVVEDRGEEIPEGLRDLRYTDDPAVRRILVKGARRRLGMTPGQVVDLIFQNCYSEEEFDRTANDWHEAMENPMTKEELRDWAMRRRGLKR